MRTTTAITERSPVASSLPSFLLIHPSIHPHTHTAASHTPLVQATETKAQKKVRLQYVWPQGVSRIARKKFGPHGMKYDTRRSDVVPFATVPSYETNEATILPTTVSIGVDARWALRKRPLFAWPDSHSLKNKKNYTIRN